MILVKERLEELTDYASKDVNFDNEIQEADLEYWMFKYKRDVILGCTEKEMESNFPSNRVFLGLIGFLRDYFEIHIVEKEIDSPLGWNEDVKLYNVAYKDHDIGTFYYDPYSKNDNQTSDSIQGRIRGRSIRNGCKACLYLSMRMKKSARGHTHMSQENIKSLFYGIGVIVQELLCKEEFYELNIKGPWKEDTDRVIPNLFLSWLLRDPRILQSCSFNQREGKELSLATIERILNCMTHFNCVHNADQLYKSHLDLELSTTQIDIKKLAPKVCAIYKSLPYDTSTYHYCNDLSLMVSKSGMYYSGIWSKIVATKCFDLYEVSQDVSSEGIGMIKQTSERIVNSFFDADGDTDLIDRLARITGNGFDFSQPSLGVL